MTKLLNTYLANLALWQLKLHNYHWNVTGRMFVSVHEWTEKLYDEAFDQFDAVAEVLKMRGEMPLVTSAEYQAAATLKEVEGRAYTVAEVLAGVEAFGVRVPGLSDFADELPFAANGLEWIVPALVGAALGVLLSVFGAKRA